MWPLQQFKLIDTTMKSKLLEAIQSQFSLRNKRAFKNLARQGVFYRELQVNTSMTIIVQPEKATYQLNHYNQLSPIKPCNHRRSYLFSAQVTQYKRSVHIRSKMTLF
jgi:hypothetical protein